MSWFEELRAAARSLRRARSFVLLTAGTLSLGVGLTTGIFSVVHAVLLRPLPYVEPQRLVAVGKVWGSSTEPKGVSEPEIVDWRERARSFESIEFTEKVQFVVHDDAAVWVTGARASVGLFSSLGVRPFLGRTFYTEEHQPAQGRVALISERLWRSQFASDPAIIGQSVRLSLNGAGQAQSFEIVGVLQRTVPIDYHQPLDVIIPFIFDGSIRGPGARQSAELQAIARLKPGTSLEEAALHMQMLSEELNREYPTGGPAATVALRPLHEHLLGSTGPLLMALSAAVSVVLMICVINLCGLLMIRSARQRHETAIRLAIGADNRRLLRLMAAEGSILCALGAAGGLLVSTWVAGLLGASAPASVLRVDQIRLDHTVVVGAIAVTVFAAAAASLLPAYRATRTIARDSLNNRGAVTRRNRREAIVACQTCFVTIVLAAGGLLVGSVIKLSRQPLGFDFEGMVAVQLVLPDAWLQDGSRRTAFERDVLANVRALPGVIGASVSSDIPMSAGPRIGVRIGDLPRPELISVTAAHPGYLRLLNVSHLRGRGLSETDTASSPRVALVNRAFVEHYSPLAEVLGQRLTLVDTHEIVGVVENIVEWTDGVSRLPGLIPSAKPAVYIPAEQLRMGRIAYIVIRHESSFSSASVTPQITAVAPSVTVRQVQALGDLVRSTYAETRFYATALMLFGVVGLSLSAVGVYGVVAQSVGERRAEFGVRMALGSTPGKLFRMVLVQTGAALTIGAGVGVLIATQLTWLLGAWIFGLSPTEPLALASVVAILLIVGLSAASYPARAAARVDPTEALKH